MGHVESPQDRPFDLGTALASHFIEVGVVPQVVERDGEPAIAVEFDLPLELPDEAVLNRAGFRLRELAAEEHIVSAGRVLELDQEFAVPRYNSGRPDLAAAAEALGAFLADLRPGVTVLRISPAEDTPEHRALTTSTAGISMFETMRAALPTLMGSSSAPRRDHVRLITYRDLRAVQRQAGRRSS